MRERTVPSKARAAAVAVALAFALPGWVDIAGRVIARGGPLRMARAWQTRRIDAFLNPWNGPTPRDRTPRG